MSDNPPDQPSPLKPGAARRGSAYLVAWWVWLFYFAIGFAVVYGCYAGVYRAGHGQVVEFDRDWKQAQDARMLVEARFIASISRLTPSKNPMLLGAGKAIFLKRCSVCHRPDAGGLVGPNLCDDYWIHGSNYTDTVNVIYNGVFRKEMMAWKTQLPPQDIEAVASYIYTLRGTHPVNPKPPENLVPTVKTNKYE